MISVHLNICSFKVELNFKEIFHSDLVGIVDNKLIVIQGVSLGVGCSCILALPPGN